MVAKNDPFQKSSFEQSYTDKTENYSHIYNNLISEKSKQKYVPNSLWIVLNANIESILYKKAQVSDNGCQIMCLW